MRNWRRKGIGKYVAHQIFDSFHGEWEVKQEKGNFAAQQFWISAIGDYGTSNYKRVESFEPEWDGPVIKKCLH